MRNTNLQKANRCFRCLEYAKAIEFYDKALDNCNDKFLRRQIIINRKLAGQRLNSLGYSERSIDVIIPVYNALDDVKKCLSSVKASCEFFPLKIILVNDGSDEKTSTYLRQFASKYNFVYLIEHAANKGYTKAVNAGLRFSEANYLVTLNSDTIVPHQWISLLLECMDNDPLTGIVGPLSNAASWQNFPLLFDENGKFAVNDLPEFFDLESLNRFLEIYGLKQFPEVPFVNGFCFMIKREVIDKIGYMDEEAFPVGYGEENDFCLRALRSSFKLAIADNVYVYHAKSKSFGHSNRSRLSREGNKRLKEKHGDQYLRQNIELIKNNKSLSSIRQELGNRLRKIYQYSTSSSCKKNIKIGFLLPVAGGGGGANSVIQEASEMVIMGFDVQVYVPCRHINRLLQIYSKVHSISEILVPFDTEDVDHWTSSADGRDLNIHYLVRDRSILVATMNTTVDLLDSILKWNTSIMPAYYAQDYEPLFYDPIDQNESYQQAFESYSKISNNTIFAKTDWIRNEIFKHHSVYVEKVRPSIDESLYFESNNQDVNIFNIIAMVRPKTPRRSASNTMKLLKQIKQKFGDIVQINIFGCKDDDPKYLDLERDFEFTNYGILTREEVANLASKSHLFIDLSTYQALAEQVSKRWLRAAFLFYQNQEEPMNI